MMSQSRDNKKTVSPVAQPQIQVYNYAISEQIARTLPTYKLEKRADPKQRNSRQCSTLSRVYHKACMMLQSRLVGV